MGKRPVFQTENDVFAVRLREMMKRRGETQISLANKITERYGKIQRQTIAAYTQGINKPNTEYLARIAAVLDVSADYLIGINDRQTLNEDKKAVMAYTGLSEAALDVLCKKAPFDEDAADTIPDYEGPAFLYSAAMDALLQSKHFADFSRCIAHCISRFTKEDVAFEQGTSETINAINRASNNKIPKEYIKRITLGLEQEITEKEKDLAIFNLEKAAIHIAEELIENFDSEEEGAV